MPIDINHFRVAKGGNPEKVRESQAKRFANTEVIDEIIEVDKALTKAKYEEETARRDKGIVSKAISASIRS